MFGKPVIFISAVSRELRSARDLVAKTLVALGYEPKWQDIAPSETGDLRGVLRKWVDDSDGVIQIVGQCYGFGAKEPDAEFGRCSYTQYEALYARQRGKKVWYVFLAPDHPTDAVGAEPEEWRDLQEAYRQKVRSYGDLYHRSATPDQTKLVIHQLRDELAHLRRRGKQAVTLVLALLLVLVLGGAWMLHQQEESNRKLKELAQQNEKLLQAMRDLPLTMAQSAQAGPKEDEATRMGRAYAALEEKLNLPKGTLERTLPSFAKQLLERSDTSALDRANALFATRKFADAEAAALQAKDKALAAAGQTLKDAIQALELAGSAAEAQIHYANALEHYRAAAALTSQERDALEWARVQWSIANILYLNGQYHEAETIYRQVNAVHIRVLGAEHTDALQSRNSLALMLDTQGKYAEAEAEHRAVVAIRERVLGKEHPDTLQSRNNLAIALRAQGKDAEAEAEHRAVLAIMERVLGKEHPDTLSSRNNLTAVLQSQSKYAEAEAEHRAVIAIRERVLGKEHPLTLTSRNNLATALRAQGKNAEAEAEHRAVLAIRERVLGAEHPDVFSSCYNLALCLEGQKKLKEALEFVQRAEKGWKKVLGEEHPSSKNAQRLREWIEAELRK